MSSGTTTFDTTTALVADPLEIDRFTVDLDPAWASLVGVHGGYLAALAINAAEALAGNRSIRTMTTTFLRPARVGPAALVGDDRRPPSAVDREMRADQPTARRSPLRPR